jgi:ElaB/YqjD/DUF883 family membrane-anchored ribosome-binding protein
MPRRNGSNPVSATPAAVEFRKRAATLRDDAVELGMAGKRLAEDALYQAGETAQDYYRQGRTRVLDFERALEDIVRAYPIRSLCVAAAAGFLLARLIARR